MLCHFVQSDHKSNFAFFTGLILGGSLIMFVVFLINECEYKPPVRSSIASFYPDYEKPRRFIDTEYTYGWSFLLAVAAFLSAEVSAVLCLSAFIQRFDSEVQNILKDYT